MSITEFLLARIASDEERARFVLSQQGHDPQPDEGYLWHDEYDLLYVAPDRVLAECEAKRRIVAWLGHTVENEFGWDGMDWFVLKQLATVHADHPDFDPEWRAE